MTDPFSDNKDDSSAPLETDVLKELVGEDKPFKTVEALAMGKAKADSFIDQLKKEAGEMRETLEAAEKKVAEATTMDALMERIRKTTEPDDGNQPKTLSQEDIQKLVREESTALDNVKREQANREVVKAKLFKHFGDDADKARAHTVARAKTLNITPSSIGDTAAVSPESALNLLGIEEGRKGPLSGPVHALPGAKSAPVGSGEEKRNFTYYNEMRKKIGVRYFDTNIQQQKMRDIEAMGEEAFYKD